MDEKTLGQIVLKENEIHLMDGIEGLRSLPQHSVDMLITDPPYGTTRNFWDVSLPLMEFWGYIGLSSPMVQCLSFPSVPMTRCLVFPTLICFAMNGCGTRNAVPDF